MQFIFVYVVKEYIDFATFSKNLLAFLHYEFFN
jgi:hypothetical protein